MRWLIVSAVAAIGLGGCKASVKRELDVSKASLEKGIAANAQNEHKVVCPDKIDFKVGGFVTCELYTTQYPDGPPVTVKVTFDDDKGNVTFEEQDRLYDLAKQGDQFVADLNAAGNKVEKVVCGDKPVVLRKGATFPCDVTGVGGQQAKLEATIGDDWRVLWKLNVPGEAGAGSGSGAAGGAGGGGAAGGGSAATGGGSAATGGGSAAPPPATP